LYFPFCSRHFWITFFCCCAFSRFQR
jgi:hypothetical protein